MYTGGVEALGIFAGTEFSSAVAQKCSGSQQRQLGQRAPTYKQASPAAVSPHPLELSSAWAAPHTGSQARSTTGLSRSECTSAGSEHPIACRHIKAFSAREGSSVTPSGMGCSITQGCPESVAASVCTVSRVTLEEIIVKDEYISAGKESRDLVYT